MNDDKNSQSIIDGFKVICICRSIRKRTILKAIKKGCKTAGEINEKTGSGKGDCQGSRCQDKVRGLLDGENKH